MISAFHPSLIFCISDKQWKNKKFQDSFIGNLLSHLDKMEELNINIAWSWEFYNCFWQNSPWLGDDYYENYLMDYLYQTMAELFEIINPPPIVECQTNPDIQTDFRKEIRLSWLTLIHRLLHNKRNTFVIIGLNIEKEIDSLSVFCNCDLGPISETYLVIKNPSEWYIKLDYMEKCPNSLDYWEEDFKVAIKMCHEQEFKMREFKARPEDIEFSDNFKESFLDLQEQGKRKRIIKKITELLTLNHQEAGRDSGLQEEYIHGEYRIRISRGERVHYRETENKKIFLEYYSSSRHDASL